MSECVIVFVIWGYSNLLLQGSYEINSGSKNNIVTCIMCTSLHLYGSATKQNRFLRWVYRHGVPTPEHWLACAESKITRMAMETDIKATLYATIFDIIEKCLFLMDTEYFAHRRVLLLCFYSLDRYCWVRDSKLMDISKYE